MISMTKHAEYLIFLKKLKDKNIIKVVIRIRRCGKSILFELHKNILFAKL